MGLFFRSYYTLEHFLTASNLSTFVTCFRMRYTIIFSYSQFTLKLRKHNVLLLLLQTDNHTPIFSIGLLYRDGYYTIIFLRLRKVERLLIISSLLFHIFMKFISKCQIIVMYNKIIVTTFGLSVLILECSICYACVQQQQQQKNSTSCAS